VLKSYKKQLEEKKRALEQKLNNFYPKSVQVFESPEQHYRMRAEFRVWHEGDDLYYVMFNSETKEKYRVDQLPIAGHLINQLMCVLIEGVKHNELLRRKLFQVDFLTSTSGEAVISLLYHKQLSDEWQLSAETFRKELQAFASVSLIGRARKQKIVLGHDFVIEALNVADKLYYFEQVENSFTQPNAFMNIKMLEWALWQTRDIGGDLLELYCGNGNFSIPLAQNFANVLATEISRTSVNSAQKNIELNQIRNLKVVRMSAEELALALKGKFESRRAEALELATYQFTTVLVDPPRAGLDADAIEQIKPYQHIIYISCNPDTLAENLKKLSETHEVVDAALFDQFPQTHHTEAGVHLRKRS